MSVAALIKSMGKTVLLRRPTYGQNNDGSQTRTYATVSTTTAFLQERSSSQQLAQGRENLRNQTVIYFEGAVDVRVDDVITDGTTSPAWSYRVTGVRIPDAASTHPNCHTIVEAARAAPKETFS